MNTEKATPNCANRYIEWSYAAIMAQIGVIVLISDVVFHTKPQLAFLALIQLGLTPVMIGVLFLFTGIARCVALKRNGKWENGPLIRAGCAAIGMLIWGQLLYGIVVVWAQTGEIYLTLGVWDTFLAFEYLSFRRALLDMKNPPAVLVAGNVR
ncbi:MAG: hypothetical protein JWL86_5430 [Rhizobium sp.]|nr:hypothetical protein [Rhizobium sp.]